MRNHLLVAGLAAAALLPSAALAQQPQHPCQPQSPNRTAGSAGATIGALLGGLLGGAQPAYGQSDCVRAYGYYDANGLWHANAIPASQAAGYYDRNGAWIEGRPNGYYDGQGRWIAAQADPQVSGYYAANGMWVPASAPGYYDAQGRWVAGAASGHYDRRGRWIAGPAVGRYDARGRWISGQAGGHRDANGVWVADPQPGYYHDGRWVAGEAYGYYDARGRWHAAVASSDRHADYVRTADWRGAPNDFRGRENWLRTRIEGGMSAGALARDDGRQALRTLDTLRSEERGLRNHRGNLAPRDARRLQAKLDDINQSLRWPDRTAARQF